MLDLEADRWGELTTSVGGTGALVAELLKEVEAGNTEVLEELSQQICHQLGPAGTASYAAVPHCVRLMEVAELDSSARTRLLTMVGRVANAARLDPAHSPAVPEDLEPAYREAERRALAIACADLQKPLLSFGETSALLAVVAAIRGACDLATHLFLHAGREGPLECPSCGESITWVET